MKNWILATIMFAALMIGGCTINSDVKPPTYQEVYEHQMKADELRDRQEFQEKISLIEKTAAPTPSSTVTPDVVFLNYCGENVIMTGVTLKGVHFMWNLKMQLEPAMEQDIIDVLLFMKANNIDITIIDLDANLGITCFRV